MAISFPANPSEGDLYQNPATGAFYEYTDDSWSVKCFENQLSPCDPQGEWENKGEVTSNSTPSNGIYWRVIPPDLNDPFQINNSTKVMLANAERLPAEVANFDRIFLNGQGFAIAYTTSVGGEVNTISLHGDQRAFFEDPENATIAYKFCDGDAYVTLDYFNADQKRQDDTIVELAEEINALAPVLERGYFISTAGATGPGEGEFFIRNTTGKTIDYTDPTVNNIIISKKDKDGGEHFFTNVEVGQILHLFEEGVPDNGFYKITGVAGNNGPTDPSPAVTFDVELISGQGEATVGDVARLRISDPPSGGDASEFVKKIGDTMTGALGFSRYDQTDPTVLDAQALIVPGSGTGSSRGMAITTAFEPGVQPHTSFNLLQEYIQLKNLADSGGTRAQLEIGPTKSQLSAAEYLELKGSKNVLLYARTEEIKIKAENGGVEITGANDRTKNNFKIGNGKTVFEWGDTGVNFITEGNIENLSTVTPDPTTGLTINGNAQYLGQIQDDDDLVNKKYVDENSGGVEIINGTPNAPIPLGKMWFDTSKNALFLKTAN